MGFWGWMVDRGGLGRVGEEGEREKGEGRRGVRKVR